MHKRVSYLNIRTMKAPALEIIHLVAGKSSPEALNDVTKVIFDLATQQALAGRSVSVWSVDDDLSQFAIDKKFSVLAFKKQRRKFKLDQDLITAIEARKGQAVYHLHGGFIPVFYAISKFLASNNIPFVFTPHGAYNLVSLERSGFIKSLYTKFFERKLVERAAYIHCLGQSELEGVRAIYPQAKALLVPYGYAGEAALMATPDKNKFIIGYCGRLDIFTKGLDLLINAFAFVKQVHPGAELWIIGDSAERVQLHRQIVSRGLQEDVILWGKKSDEEKIKLLSKINMFIHPSRDEDLPVPVIEAASMGIPCVVSEASNIGVPVRNFDCGEVVDNPDENDLFKAIMNLHYRIDLDGIKVFSQKAREMVAQEYNWQKIISKYDCLYQTA